MSVPLTARALLWGLLGAVVALWLGYAVVAGMTQASPSRPAAHPRPAALPESAQVGLGLSPAPALRVRSAVLGQAPARTIVRRTRRAPARHRAPLMSAPVTPATTPVATAPVRQTPVPTPAPRPARKPQTTVTAQPKQPARPGFDQSSPSGFDNSG